LRLHVGAGFLDGHRSRGPGGVLQLADRAYTPREGKHCMHHLLRCPFGQAIGARTQRHRRLDSRTIGATGDPGGPRRSGHLAACRAPHLRPWILGHPRLDRRSLPHLMPPWRGIVSRYGRMAVHTLVGLDDHDLIDLIHRHPGACMARMAWLPTTTAGTPWAPRRLCGGRITRGRVGRMLQGAALLL
jgi:hypothetical protein